MIGFILTLVGAFPVYADTIDSIVSTASDIQVGKDYAIWWGYKPAAGTLVCQVTIPLKKVGSPTDALFMDIRYGTTTYPLFNSSVLTGTVLVDHADSGWQISGTSYANYTFTFTPCVPMASQWYNFILFRSGALDNTNYYQLQGRDGSGAAATITGSATWFADRLLNQELFHSNVYPSFAPTIIINGSSDPGAPTLPPVPFGPTVQTGFSALNDTNATSSIEDSFASLANIPGYFARKVPWGYIFDIKDVYTAAATTTSDFGTIYLDFSDTRISTGTRSWLPGRIAVFSTSTIGYYFNGIALDGANTLLAAAGWIMAIVYWYKRATAT